MNEPLHSKTSAGSQLITRLLTFALNVVATRSLTPSAYGVASVQFHLINTFILFLSREGFRRGCLRIPPNTPTTIATTLGTSMLSIPIGALLSLIVTTGILYTSHSSSESLHFHTAIILQGIAAFLEILSEPLYILATAQLALGFRVTCEAVAMILKNAVTLWMLYINVDAVLSFSWGQTAYAATLFIGYCGVYLVQHRTLLMHVRPRIDPSILRICGTFSIQTIGKLMLAEGSKAVLAAATPASQQGVYGLVNNLGSLVVRTVFQPYEEIAFIAFSRDSAPSMMGHSEGKEQQQKKERLDPSPHLRTRAALLGAMCRGIFLLGSVAAAFGPAYSYVALYALYGQRWAASGASTALGMYSQYIALLALNGILEAFVHASADAKDLMQVNAALVVLSLLHIALSVVGVTHAGAIGLLLADSVNMCLRIVYCLVFLSRFFAAIGGLKSVALWPQRTTMAVLMMTMVCTVISEAIWMPESSLLATYLNRAMLGRVVGAWGVVKYSFEMRMMCHVGFGAVFLGLVGAMLLKNEADVLQYLKGRRDGSREAKIKKG